MKILKGIEKLAVDANPILSAIIGGNSRTVFLTTENIVFYTTAFNLKEVEKYIPVLAEKRDIPLEDLYLAVSMLPILVCGSEVYKDKINKAQVMLGERDPDDIHLLALSLKLGCPIWSNDKDFGELGVTVYTTLDLIRK
ncbi:MAG: PIN domain nuclease [Nitrospirae bacterium]|nr:PIN domain nuclease [Nitrospirota bacterium]